MFELPIITCVGRVEDSVLGVAVTGYDLDGTMMFGDFEFLEDGDGNES
jgi:hypothetical protein